jgi:hypothetical protein
VLRTRSVAVAALVILVAACSVPPGSGLPAALATPSETAFQTAEPTRTPTPTATPRPTPTARPSPTPSPVLTATPRPSPYDAALEAMFPRALRGIEFQRLSAPMAPFAGGGDMCIFVCADEPGRLSKASGVPIERMTLGLGLPAHDDSGFAAGVMAIRFRGVDDRSLVDVRLRAGSHSTPTGLPPDTVRLKVGDRAVTWAIWWPLHDDRYGEYLLEHGDVLFIVQGEPPSPDGTVSGDVALLIEALP